MKQTHIIQFLPFVIRRMHYQFESFKDYHTKHGLLSALKEAIYFNKEVIVLERELEKPLPTFAYTSDVKLVRVERKNFGELTPLYQGSNKIRLFKSLAYLDSGYSGFLGICQNTLIGDVWWVKGSHNPEQSVHPDLRWLKIHLKDDEVYTFDLFVTPESREKGIANLFVMGYLRGLRRLGYSKAFAYVFTDNIPSMWTQRILSWKEIDRIKRHRFFYIEIKGRYLCLT